MTVINFIPIYDPMTGRIFYYSYSKGKEWLDKFAEKLNTIEKPIEPMTITDFMDKNMEDSK